jgi:glycosyltransferase involved in cell wall biosynthesis
MSSSPFQRSVVVPVYGNEETIPDLVSALNGLAERHENMEVVFVIDGSPDDSQAVLESLLPDAGFSSTIVVHSRNFGEFAAIRTGLEAAKGDVIGVIAADLQEPPELLSAFFEELESGSVDIVFGQRRGRDDPFLSRMSSSLYWAMYRRLVIPDIPPGGVDVFGVTSEVRDVIISLNATNTSLIAQLFWIGFRRKFVPYNRIERDRGSSGWTLGARFRYMADSVIGFTDLPIIALVWLGIIGVAFSAVIGLATLVLRLAGLIPVPGFATIVIASSFLLSLILLSQGIVGLYLWRTFELAKELPSSIVMERHSITASDEPLGED